MKKYIPSVKKNEELKNGVVKELKSLIYKLEKGKITNLIDAEMLAQLKEGVDSLDGAIGTGKENVFAVEAEAQKQIKELKKALNGDLKNRINYAVSEVVSTLELWTDILAGEVAEEDDVMHEKERVSREKRKLDLKLAELEEIQANIAKNDKSIEQEILALEKDLAEYNELMLTEDNERIINDLYRKIKANVSKNEMLVTRKNNYSACLNLLSMIYANAKEILRLTNLSATELSRAKVILNIGKLREVLSNPDKVITILKIMDKEIKEIVDHVVHIDEYISGFNNGKLSVSKEALAYKEELMRKKREKQNLDSDVIIQENTSNKKDTVTEGN